MEEVALCQLAEGWCVQMLHIGPYADEGKSVALMSRHAEANGKVLHGAHHEIFLSDPRRVPEDRLKTILRIPVRDLYHERIG